MGNKVLLIESDAAFASEISRALEARGLEVRVSGDGKEGIDLARDERPDAVVLCVELPRMSGYSVCQKLKKDDALKGIPLVLTSAEASEETFEAHRKLKARADEYLIKPFSPAQLVERLGALIALPPAPMDGEELVTLDDVEELSGDIPLRPEPPARAAALPSDDEDLKLLDSAFDHISATAAEAGQAAEPPAGRAASRPAELALEQEVEGADLRAAAALLPPDSDASRADLDRLGEEADKALAALGADEPPEGVDLASAEALLDEPPPSPASEEAFRADDVEGLEPPARPGPGGDADPRLQGRLSEMLLELARTRESLDRSRDEADALRARVGELEAGLRRAEDALREAEEASSGASDRAGRLEEEVAALRLQVEDSQEAATLKAAEAAETAGKADLLARSLAAAEAGLAEFDGLRAQLEAARAEQETARAAADGARGDADRAVAELRKRIQELEVTSARHEERIVKAYQKIKSDERIREKTRKALSIALQLLDERMATQPAKEGEPAPRRE